MPDQLNAVFPVFLEMCSYYKHSMTVIQCVCVCVCVCVWLQCNYWTLDNCFQKTLGQLYHSHAFCKWSKLCTILNFVQFELCPN